MMIQNQEFTYIGKSANLNGQFNFSGTTHIQGSILGDIVIDHNAKLILEVGSFVQGTLHCYDIDIYGNFVGDINSHGRVTIYPTATLSGKIIAKAIEILPGAIVNMNGHTDDII